MRWVEKIARGSNLKILKEESRVSSETKRKRIDKRQRVERIILPVHLQIETYRKLQKAAKLWDMSIQDFVREAVGGMVSRVLAKR